MENIFEIIRTELEELAKEHRVAASNERLWAKGASNAEAVEMHEDNAIVNSKIADIYSKLAANVYSVVETYGDYYDE